MAQPKPKPEDTLAAYAAIQRAADREILAELRNAFKDTTRQLAVLGRQGNRDVSLERQRVLAIRQALLLEQAKFYERAGNVIQRRRVEAAARAIQVSGRYDEAAFRAAGRIEDLRALSESLEETEAKAPEALVARLSPDGSRTQLSSRVYRTQAYSQGLVERRVNSALARGLNAEQFSREVRDLIDPNTPGGVRFASLRLARSEINNAYHAMTIRAAELKPWVVGMEWHISGSHSRPDECDKLNGDVFKPPADTPRKPHPQCMCYVTPVVGGDNGEVGDDAFLDDLVNGLFDDDIEALKARQAAPAPPATVTPAAPPKAKAAKTAKKAPAKKAAAAPAKAAPPTTEREPEFVLPRMGNVPEGEHARRLMPDDPMLRRELDLQEAITPECAAQLFGVEAVPFIGTGVGGLHTRELRRIQIATGLSDGTTGRAIYDKAERNRFHPKCGAEHSSAQLHLAHEYGHHVHQMLDFMPDEDRIELWNTVADITGTPRPNIQPLHEGGILDFEGGLRRWIAENKQDLEFHFGRYAMGNERELLAEVWSAYSTNPDTMNRAIKTIGPLMRRLAEQGARRGQVSRPDEDAKRMEALADKLKKAMEQGLL